LRKNILSSFSLDGKKILITGGSRGIGKAISAIYSEMGADVIICGRKQESVEETAREIKANGGHAFPVAANVTLPKDRVRLIDTAIQWAGRIDILVNNAGGNPKFGGLSELSESVWDKTFELNLKAPFVISQMVYNTWMKENGGVIINMASVGGLITSSGINAYNITKAALIHLTKCLAQEWGPSGIRVNAIAPGLIKTEMSRALWDSPMGEKMVKSNPLKRIGEVNDVKSAALFLASDASSFITGHTLLIDGGQLIK